MGANAARTSFSSQLSGLLAGLHGNCIAWYALSWCSWGLRNSWGGSSSETESVPDPDDGKYNTSGVRGASPPAAALVVCFVRTIPLTVAGLEEVGRLVLDGLIADCCERRNHSKYIFRMTWQQHTRKRVYTSPSRVQIVARARLTRASPTYIPRAACHTASRRVVMANQRPTGADR